MNGSIDGKQPTPKVTHQKERKFIFFFFFFLFFSLDLYYQMTIQKCLLVTVVVLLKVDLCIVEIKRGFSDSEGGGGGGGGKKKKKKI